LLVCTAARSSSPCTRWTPDRVAKQKVSVSLFADNPDVWMLHCHNIYHQEAGMMTSLNLRHVTMVWCRGRRELLSSIE
jgi:FtsP/CotA-like multicopper oxidase with cupredoxin domain